MNPKSYVRLKKEETFDVGFIPEEQYLTLMWEFLK